MTVAAEGPRLERGRRSAEQICRTIVQLEVCRASSGRAMGMNITAQYHRRRENMVGVNMVLA